MLLCLSSRQRRVFEEPVEVSGEVALEAAGGLAASFSFLESAFDVVGGRSVRSASGNDDLALATAANWRLTAQGRRELGRRRSGWLRRRSFRHAERIARLCDQAAAES